MQADLSSSIVRRNFPEKMSGLKIEESLGFTIFLDFPFGQFGPIFRANSLLNFQGKTWPFEAPLKKKHPSNFDFHQFFFGGFVSPWISSGVKTKYSWVRRHLQGCGWHQGCVNDEPHLGSRFFVPQKNLSAHPRCSSPKTTEDLEG